MHDGCGDDPTIIRDYIDDSVTVHKPDVDIHCGAAMGDGNNIIDSDTDLSSEKTDDNFPGRLSKLPGKIDKTRGHNRRKAVLKLDASTGITIQRYASIHHAVSSNAGLNRMGISFACRGRTASYDGFIWKFEKIIDKVIPASPLPSLHDTDIVAEVFPVDNFVSHSSFSDKTNQYEAYSLEGHGKRRGDCNGENSSGKYEEKHEAYIHKLLADYTDIVRLTFENRHRAGSMREIVFTVKTNKKMIKIKNKYAEIVSISPDLLVMTCNGILLDDSTLCKTVHDLGISSGSIVYISERTYTNPFKKQRTN